MTLKKKKRLRLSEIESRKKKFSDAKNKRNMNEESRLLFLQLKKVLSVFETLAFIDLRVIMQHAEKALKAPPLPPGQLHLDPPPCYPPPSS